MSAPDDVPTPVVGRRRRPRRRRTRTVAWVSLAAGVSLMAGAALGQAGQSTRPAEPRSAPAPLATGSTTSAPALRTSPDAEEQRAMALVALLKVRSAAVLGGDKAAWMATVDPASATFSAAQSRVFDNLREVPFSGFGYDFAGVAPELSAARQGELGATAWVARVVADYQLKDYDRTPTQTEQYLTSVQRSGRWYLAADSDGPTAAQPWDLGRVRLVRGDHVLALGTVEVSALRDYAAQGDRAVERVSTVWGRKWPRRAVLVVPRTEDEMGKLLMRTDGLDQVAAVTTGELSGSGTAGSDRVVINPSAFAKLGTTGQRVVLTHEMTHVAVRSSTSAAVPIWLSEGFADYVGYQGVGLGRRTVAADELALVRQGEGFTQLPTVADFDPAATTIAPSYSAAWLACSLIADRYGRAKLVELYRVTASNQSDDPDTALTQAFQSVLGTSEAAFTTRWRAYLTSLATG